MGQGTMVQKMKNCPKTLYIKHFFKSQVYFDYYRSQPMSTSILHSDQIQCEPVPSAYKNLVPKKEESNIQVENQKACTW